MSNCCIRAIYQPLTRRANTICAIDLATGTGRQLRLDSRSHGTCAAAFDQTTRITAKWMAENDQEIYRSGGVKQRMMIGVGEEITPMF